MKQRFFYIIWLVVASVITAGLRIWNRMAAYGTERIPVAGHLTTWILAAFCIAALITFLIIALRNSAPEPASGPSMLRFILQTAGAVLVLISVPTEFGPELYSVKGKLMVALGLIAAIALLISVLRGRTSNRQSPISMILMLVYLLVRLVINFKHWSLDPIVLDYCMLLFGMIFILTAVYSQTGILFDLYHPRRTAFLSMGACMFSAAAAIDGLLIGDLSVLLIYSGFLLWCLPASADALQDKI